MVLDTHKYRFQIQKKFKARETQREQEQIYRVGKFLQSRRFVTVFVISTNIC